MGFFKQSGSFSCDIITATTRSSLILFVLLLTLPAAFCALGAEKTDDCFECHEQFKGYQHGDLNCASCHSGIAALPHDERVVKPACRICHSAEVKTYMKGVHSEKGIKCEECHDTHFAGNKTKGCLSCHKALAHALLPAKEKHLAAFTCQGCHSLAERGSVEVVVRTGKNFPLTKELVDLNKDNVVDKGEWDHLDALLAGEGNGRYMVTTRYLLGGSAHAVTALPVACEECHHERGLLRTGLLRFSGKTAFEIPISPGIFVPKLPSAERFMETVHGREGVQCADCHVSRDKIDDHVCASCHETTYAVYKNTGHARKGAARCTDCHNPHAIKAYKELGARGRLAVCSRCHKDYLAKHDWLPATALHFEYLECSTCHSPLSEKSMVFFFQIRKNGNPVPISGEELALLCDKGRTIRNAIDTNGDGAVSSPELTGFFVHLQERYGRNVLIGSSIVVTRVHHDYSETRLKERACKTCHSADAPFYSSMYLILPEKSGYDYVPVKGTILSEVPVTTFVDICLLGQEKIKLDDLKKLWSLRWGLKRAYVYQLGLKWIDLAGMFLTFFILLGILVHVVLRVVVKR
jgi:predicted CXXCH cytochrome family protein